MNQFRLFEPAPKARFEQRTSLPLSRLDKPISLALQKGYITEDNDYWYLTKHGKLFLNSLLELFL